MTKALADFACGEPAVVDAEGFLRRQGVSVDEFRAAIAQLQRGGVYHGSNWSLTPPHPRVRYA